MSGLKIHWTAFSERGPKYRGRYLVFAKSSKDVEIRTIEDFELRHYGSLCTHWSEVPDGPFLSDESCADAMKGFVLNLPGAGSDLRQKDYAYTCECGSVHFHIRKDGKIECASCLNDYEISAIKFGTSDE